MPSKVAYRSSIYPHLPQSIADVSLSRSQHEARLLIDAVTRNDKRQLGTLLMRGADPNSQNSDGETPLHVAVKQDNAQDLIQLLLVRGADPNIGAVSRNYTPVHVASIADRSDYLRLLLEHGGDLYRKSTDGCNALDYAVDCKSSRVLTFLRKYLDYARGGANAGSYVNTDEYRMPLDSPTLPYGVPTEGYDVYAAQEGTSRSRRKHRSRSARQSSSSRSRSRSSYDSSDSDSDTSPQRRRVEFFSPKPVWTSAEVSDRPIDLHLEDKQHNFWFKDICALVKNQSVPNGTRQIRPSRSLDGQKPPAVRHSSESARRSLPDIAQDTPAAPEVTFDEMMELMQLPDKELRQELKRYGLQPGPFHDASTRTAYIRKLAGLKRDSVLSLAVVRAEHSAGEFGSEMTSVIHGSYNYDRMWELEHMFEAAFPKDAGPLQYGNYLLLDPQITQNLPYQVEEAKRPDLDMCFRVFLRGVFYIGKMKSCQRPKEHLRLAKMEINRSGSKLSSQKLCRIRSIWSKNCGVVLLNCFPFTDEKEALTREALMIEAIGLNKLTNERGGSLHGPIKQWSGYEKRLLGSSFLRQAFNSLLKKGERQTFRDEV